MSRWRHEGAGVSYPQKLQRSQTCQLHDGDYLFLLENLYPFLVRVEHLQSTEQNATPLNEEEATQKLDSQPLSRGLSVMENFPEAWPASAPQDKCETTAIPATLSTSTSASETTTRNSTQQQTTKRKLDPNEELPSPEPTAKRAKCELQQNTVPQETTASSVQKPPPSSEVQCFEQKFSLQREDSFTQGAVRIDPNDLEIVRRIGFGTCGEVMLAYWTKNHTHVAVKKIFRTLLHDNVLKEFKAEANILKFVVSLFFDVRNNIEEIGRRSIPIRLFYQTY